MTYDHAAGTTYTPVEGDVINIDGEQWEYQDENWSSDSYAPHVSLQSDISAYDFNIVTSTTPMDVWLQFDSENDEEARAEANTFREDGQVRIDWYLNSVGLVKSVYFDTYEEATAWYEREGFQDFSS